MALIKCHECGKEISDKAQACIQCGLPLNNQSGLLMVKAQKYPEFGPSPTKQIGIYDTKDDKLVASLHSGSGISVVINHEMEIYAKLMNI